MKEKIIIFITGLLLGAIIATGSIYFYTVATNNNTKENFQMNDRTRPNMPNNEGGTPPELPTNTVE